MSKKIISFFFAFFSCYAFSAQTAICNMQNIVESAEGKITAVDSQSSASKILQGDFERILRQARISYKGFRLLVTANPAVIAQSLPGVVVVNAEIAQLNRQHRIFVLAHEIGHLRASHWDQYFQKARSLCAAPSEPSDDSAFRELSHANEYAADKFAVFILKQNGFSSTAAVELLRSLGDIPETNTHPAIASRIQAVE